MLIDDLKEQLKHIEPDIQAIKAYWQNAKLEEEFQRLTELSHGEEFWKNPDQTPILQSLQKIKVQREHYLEIINAYQELFELLDLFATDEQELKKLSHDISEITRRIGKFKINLLLSDPQDNSNCFLSINSGAGGTESQDWASILLRMYVRFCEENKFSAQVLDYQSGEQAGIKSATLFIKAKNAYGLLKSEHGIHRLVRISPYDAN